MHLLIGNFLKERVAGIMHVAGDFPKGKPLVACLYQHAQYGLVVIAHRCEKRERAVNARNSLPLYIL